MSVTPRQRSRRRLTGFRVVVFVLLGLFFVIPLLSMLDFSTRTLGGGRDLDAWKALGQDAQLRSAIITSLELGKSVV